MGPGSWAYMCYIVWAFILPLEMGFENQRSFTRNNRVVLRNTDLLCYDPPDYMCFKKAMHQVLRFRTHEWVHLSAPGPTRQKTSVGLGRATVQLYVLANDLTTPSLRLFASNRGFGTRAHSTRLALWAETKLLCCGPSLLPNSLAF